MGFGPRSVQRHVAAMMGALNMIPSAVVASSMPRSQLVTLLVSFVAGQRCAVQTCQKNRQKGTWLGLQISHKAIVCRFLQFRVGISSKERGSCFYIFLCSYTSRLL